MSGPGGSGAGEAQERKRDRERGRDDECESALDAYVAAASTALPAIPRIAAEIARLAGEPTAPLDELRRLVERDPALTARILKTSNSPVYDFPEEVRSLSLAFSLLGREAVCNSVLAVSMERSYERLGLMERLLWQHATLAGPVAARLAEHPAIKLDAKQAYTAGTLHDVGKIALANSHPDEYERVVSRVYNEATSFVAVEREHFGFDHAQLGARVATAWSLPAGLVAVIEHHHDPAALACLPDETANMTALVSLATACLTRLGVGRREPVPDLDLTAHPAWRYLGLERGELDRVLGVCRHAIAKNRRLVR
ncbi:MAG: HDOD domain-containing protein [Myxococcota bacterium]|nr:HDOD domain-containing protein [Myxococcales bacterium]